MATSPLANSSKQEIDYYLDYHIGEVLDNFIIDRDTSQLGKKYMDLAKSMVTKFSVKNMTEYTTTTKKYNIFQHLDDETLKYVNSFIDEFYPEARRMLNGADDMGNYIGNTYPLMCNYMDIFRKWKSYYAKIENILKNPAPDTNMVEDVCVTIIYYQNELTNAFNILENGLIMSKIGRLENTLREHYNFKIPICYILCLSASEYGVSFIELYENITTIMEKRNIDTSNLDAVFWIIYAEELLYLYGLECEYIPYNNMPYNKDSILKKFEQKYSDDCSRCMDKLEVLDEQFIFEIENHTAPIADPLTENLVDQFLEKMGITTNIDLHKKQFEDSLLLKKYLDIHRKMDNLYNEIVNI